MKRMRIMGLLLVGAFAVSMLATATASAFTDTVEFGRCKKEATKTFKYSNSGCTTNKAGSSTESQFEWYPGPGPKPQFTSAMVSGTKATLETKSGTKITCNKETGTGEVTGVTSVGKVLAKFTECESGGGVCTGKKGEPAGTIITEALKGKPGIVKQEAKVIKDIAGSDLRPETGTSLANFGCLGGVANVEVRNSLIVKVKTEKMLGSAKLEFAALGGEQIPQQFEGEPVENLESNLAGSGLTFEKSGQTITTVQKNKEKMELRVCRNLPTKCE